MALPESRNESYTEDDPVKSVTLNDLQDCVIEGAHGDLVLNLHTFDGIVNVPANCGPQTGVGYMLWAGAAVLSMAIPLHQGDRIKSVSFALYGDGAADLAVGIAKITAAGAVTIINPGAVTTSILNTPAAWTDNTIDVTDTTLAAGECLMMWFDVPVAPMRTQGVRVTYDHPL